MPKTLKNVWERIIDVKNLDLAYKIPSEYSEDLEYIEKFNKRKPQRIKYLNENLRNKKYEVSKYIIDTVYEPKEREIYKLPNYPDKTIQRAVVKIIEPDIVKGFIPNTFACIKKRGIHTLISAGIFLCSSFDKNKFFSVFKFDY